MGDPEDELERAWRSLPDPRFESMVLSELLAAADIPSSAADDVFDYALEKKRAKIDRAKAENEMRSKFFTWASRLATGMIVANFIIFLIYLLAEVWYYEQSEVLPAGVMVAWTSATVVEIIGIVAIIARHLFPGRRASPGR